MREERLDLGGKQEVIAALGVKERSNAEAIAREKQRTRTRVPDRERPLAVELPHGVRAQFLVQVQDDFCIGYACEVVPAGEQFLAKLEVVEDFAVELNPEGAVLVGRRLSAATNVDHAQTGVGEPSGGFDVLT